MPRRPKPTALKILNGNPGKRRLNANEPKAEITIPDCPEHLNEIARAEWNRITPELASAGLLTRLDRAAIALYCQTWAIWVEAEDKVRKRGRVIVTKSGYPVLNPQHTIATKAANDCKTFAIEFGLTPSSRSRIDIDSSTDKVDPIKLFTIARNA